MSVAVWPLERRPLLSLGRRRRTEFAGGNAGAERIDQIRYARGALSYAVQFRDGPGIGFQPFETLAGDRVHDGAAAFLQVVGSGHFESPMRHTFYPEE